MLTHDYWRAVADEMLSYAEFDPDDIVLTAQTFYDIDPLWNTAACMTAGADRRSWVGC